MKIRRLDRALKGTIKWTLMITAVPVILLVAAMLPGDPVNVNMIGAIALIFGLGVLDAVIILPCVLWLRKIDRPVLPPVRRTKW